MAVTVAWEQDALSVTTTELSLTNGTSTLANQTDPGVYQLWVDVKNTSDPLAKGEILTLKIYEKVEATGGTRDVVWSATLSDAQSQIFVAPSLMLINGFDFSAQLNTGTITLDATIRKVG